MRATGDVDAARYQQVMEQARAASDAGDSVREAGLLRTALILLTGPLPTGFAVPEPRLSEALRTASPILAETILDLSLELGCALLKHSLGEGLAWVEFVAAALGPARPDDNDYVRRMRTNLLAAQGIAQLQIAGPALARNPPPARDEGAAAPGGAAVQRLAVAMNHARQLAGAGQPRPALDLISRELQALEADAPMADELAELARLLCVEIAATMPQDKRTACRLAHDILRRRSAHEAVVMLLRSAGYAQDAGRRDLAWRDLTEALRACAAPDARPLRWQVLWYMAETEMSAGRAGAAICLSKLALKEHISLRRQLDAHDPALAELPVVAERAIDQLVDLLVEAGRLDEAEQVARICLAPDIATTEPPSLTRAEAEIAREIERRVGGSASLRYTVDRLAEIQSAGPGVAEDDMSAPAPPGSAILSFIPHGGSLSCLVATTGCTVRVDLGIPVGQAHMLAYRARRAVIDGCGASEPVLREAFDCLLRAPVAAAGPVRSLHIAARGGLRTFPWAAAHDGAAFLVERFALLRLAARPSRATRPPAPAPLLAAFAASREARGLGALGANAAQEARKVASQVRQGRALVDDDFTEQAVGAAMREATILHFATHFVADPAEATSSRLILGDGGALPLGRLIAMSDGNVDLMILSCCASAIGGSPSEDGSSIDELLLKGNIAAVMGTLWQVDGTAMSLIVPEMVAGLAAGLDKPEALARAQRRLIAGDLGEGRYRLPYFFAAPIISGDPSPWDSGAFAR